MAYVQIQGPQVCVQIRELGAMGARASRGWAEPRARARLLGVPLNFSPGAHGPPQVRHQAQAWAKPKYPEKSAPAQVFRDDIRYPVEISWEAAQTSPKYVVYEFCFCFCLAR
eukprot:scaffold8654_cov23-Tisochrysis_lutea.AAC.1